jgi:phage tail protein X
MATYTAKSNQTLYDIALQVYGVLESAVDIAYASGYALASVFNGGEIITLPETTTSNANVQALVANAVTYVATGSGDIAITSGPWILNISLLGNQTIL